MRATAVRGEGQRRLRRISSSCQRRKCISCRGIQPLPARSDPPETREHETASRTRVPKFWDASRPPLRRPAHPCARASRLHPSPPLTRVWSAPPRGSPPGIRAGCRASRWGSHVSGAWGGREASTHALALTRRVTRPAQHPARSRSRRSPPRRPGTCCAHPPRRASPPCASPSSTSCGSGSGRPAGCRRSFGRRSSASRSLTSCMTCTRWAPPAA